MIGAARDLRRTLGRLWRRGVLGIVAVTLAVTACYGVLALAAFLPLLGVRLALDDALWGGTIVAFAALTVVAVLPGVRAHGARVPLAAAVAGGGLIGYALLVAYHPLVELAGFVVLAGAVAHDAVLHRRARHTPVSARRGRQHATGS